MTTVQIANLALAKIGAGRIELFDETSPLAEQVRTHYEPVLAELLRSAPWGFAVARANTAALPAPAFGWSHAFQLPSDCIQVLEANGIDPEHYPQDSFAIEGGSILCNAEECKVRYIKLELDPNKYPIDFVEAFATLLAARMCVALTKNWELAATLENRCLGPGGMLPKASRQNSNESRGRRTDRVLESDLVRARWS